MGLAARAGAILPMAAPSGMAMNSAPRLVLRRAGAATSAGWSPAALADPPVPAQAP